MSIIFPFCALVLLFLFWRKRSEDWKSSVLLASLSWGVILTLITELTSTLRQFSFTGLFVGWFVTSAILAVVVKSQTPKAITPIVANGDKLTPYLKLLLIGVTAIVFAIGLIALIAPPNNWDSMTYHMGRVVHWIQNRSVAHYPTHIIRQLHPGPWSSFAIAHLQILSRSDRFANLIQWMSMIGSLIGVSAIANQLCAGVRGQVFSVVVCATIPMGILQASSTQNDYVLAFWLICLSYCVLEAIQSKFETQWVLAAGVGLGLAILTKGTAYLYAFPFCLWLLFAGFHRVQFKVWKPMLGFGATAIAINIGHYLRNWGVFGSFLGKSGQGLEAFSLSIFLSNILRNIALHLSTPVRSINLITIDAVESLHRLIGIDVSDPRTTSPVGYRFDIHSLINHEDLAGNFIHLLLFICVTVIFFIGKNSIKHRQRYFLITYWLAILCGFLLFCALIIWSPWRSRLHLPLFVLSTPFIGSILSNIVRRPVANAVISGLLCASFIWVSFNETRPLILNSQIVETKHVQNIFNQSRTEQYFSSRPDLKEDYLGAGNFIQSQACTQIGLALGGDTWEYPLWAILNNHAESSLRIEHIHVNNDSASQVPNVYYQSFSPCALVAIGTEIADKNEFYALQNTYKREWHQGSVSVFTR